MKAYTFETTAEEVASDCRSQIEGKTILVTGASPGGLGATFATTVAKYGPACIILATRHLEKARQTAQEIANVAAGVRTHTVELDLESLARVRDAAKVINNLEEDIDVIVNNAGIMAAPFSKTVDGIERQFATNHIGHFLLTNLILPKIVARGAPVRVVNVSSSGFRLGPVRFEDWNYNDGEAYNRWVAYGQSKSANMLFSLSLAEKLGQKGVVSVSLHPGVIYSTNLSRDLAYEDFAEIGVLDRALGYKSYLDKPLEMKTPSQGVATHVYAAFHPALNAAEYNGSYLNNSCAEPAENIQSWARDSIGAEQLWKLSEQLVSQQFSYGE